MSSRYLRGLVSFSLHGLKTDVASVHLRQISREEGAAPNISRSLIVCATAVYWYTPLPPQLVLCCVEVCLQCVVVATNILLRVVL